MSSSAYRQDMPPKGGYQAVDWMRKVPKSKFSGAQMMAAYLGVTAFGWTCYAFELRKKRQERIEMDDARFAVQPLMMAEMDRMYLRRLRQNRDEEAELMKDVPGWEVGKWKGKPLYSREGPNQVDYDEYYAHSEPIHQYRRIIEIRKH